MNMNNFFTTNSQPKVNGAKSSDAVFGWGPQGGYVYQKAYIEFLVPERFLLSLIKHLNKYPSVSYQAMNTQGQRYQNVSLDDVNAVTWGVFPAKEILQPTVVDHRAFEIWATEVFDHIKHQWQVLYEKESTSFQILDRLH